MVIKYSCKEDIIQRLKNGEYFEDGNEIFDNEQYLEYLQQEENNQIQKDTSNQKTKKLKLDPFL